MVHQRIKVNPLSSEGQQRQRRKKKEEKKKTARPKGNKKWGVLQFQRVWVSVCECKRREDKEVCVRGVCGVSPTGVEVRYLVLWRTERVVFFLFCSRVGRMVPEGGCQCRGLSCRWTVRSPSSIVSSSTVPGAASVLWLWNSDSGRVSAVLFASLPLACSRSLSLYVSYSLTHLLLSLCHPAPALSVSTPGSFLFFSPVLIFSCLSCFPFFYYTLCISNTLLLTFSSSGSASLSCFPLSCLGYEDGYSPSSSPSTRPPLAVLGRQLETSSARTGLRSSHKHCSQDQRGRETSRA